MNESDEVPSTGVNSRDLLMLDLARRVQELHAAMRTQAGPSGTRWGPQLLEVAKAALTGWPTFAALFLVLFYGPIRDALTSIPEKVRSAEEIQMAGVSLKGAVRIEAARLGEVQLSEKLPKLTAEALEYLLAVPPEGDQLWSFSPDAKNDFEALWIVDDSFLSSVAELDAVGLVKVEIQIDPTKRGSANWKRISASEAKAILRGIPTKYPGKAVDGPRARLGHIPTTSIPRRELATVTCELTESGRRAKEVIMRAVAKQLSAAGEPKAR